MEKDVFTMKRKIYYHDTDAGGVAYHARYLEFLEDVRTEFLASRGIDTGRLKEESTFFVIARIEVDYKKPAEYLDEITVSVEAEKVTASCIHFRQKVSKGSVLLVDAKVVAVCVGKDWKPKRLLPSIKAAL